MLSHGAFTTLQYPADLTIPPFNFTYNTKRTNVGSAGSLDSNVGTSNVRNSAATYNPTTDTYWVHATGGGTSTYHFEYDFAGSGTNSFRGITNPDRGNRGIAWNGTYYVETIFATAPGNVKYNPTKLGAYQYDATNVEMDLVGSEANGYVDDMRQLAYSANKDQYYAVVPADSTVIIMNSSYQSVGTIDTSAMANEAGVAVSDLFNKIFVLNRDADGSGNNYIKVYNLDTLAFENNLTLLGSDMGSYFRLGGMAVDDDNRRIMVCHNNAGSGGTANLSEAWFWDF